MANESCVKLLASELIFLRCSAARRLSGELFSVRLPYTICKRPVSSNITAMPLKKEYLMISKKNKAKQTANVPVMIKIQANTTCCAAMA